MLNTNPILNFVHHLRLFYGNGYYIYLILVGLGLGETLKQEGQHTARGPHPAREDYIFSFEKAYLT